MSRPGGSSGHVNDVQGYSNYLKRLPQFGTSTGLQYSDEFKDLHKVFICGNMLQICYYIYIYIYEMGMICIMYM